MHRHVLTSALSQSYASTSSSYYAATGRWGYFIRAVHISADPAPAFKSWKETLQEEADLLREKKRAKQVEYKRKQDGQTFLDHLLVDVRSGKGGDGSVAFHREKFKPNGPPSGGNGGAGGSVYIRCTPGLNSLSSIKKQLHAAPGSNGRGTWKHGRSGQDTIVEVPVGTIVKGKRIFTEEDADEAENRWVHYPLYADTNVESDWFRKAEDALIKEERAEARARKREALLNGSGTPANDGSETFHDIFLDLTSPTPAASPGHLICSGGAGGYGNPHFSTLENRSPKWATRGRMGERVQLELELKLLADVGLVGLPNAGKSTVLRALTRSKAEVASYAFTTLNPQVGMVRVLDTSDEKRQAGAEWDSDDSTEVIEDSVVERERGRDVLQSGQGLDVSTSAASGRHSPAVDVTESFRFTIADNPGLIARASENVGLGHSFLRSIERSLALVYVVDLMSDAPGALRTLKSELEQYKPGLSRKVRMVLANKADLIGRDGDEEEAELGREMLEELRQVVREEIADEGQPEIDVVPISGKFKVNLGPAVQKMAQYVREAREQQREEQGNGATIAAPQSL
ncbi:GTPase of the mitochondrial inner membrane that associates with the large ribosomal subunit [Tulasnella sp. JGI-2019a]|nr:GTPase of the mitochondrial inner membrane that associates with the large ribosomal subunit [Tulasnella sp. JGI-2019a]